MYILAIDQGTTGTTAMIVDSKLERIAEASVDFEQHFPKPGWVEHDLDQIYTSIINAIRQALDIAQQVRSDFNVKCLIAIGITNQRETVCFWDRATGEPLARAIVWQDRRTASDCENLRSQGLESEVQARTGLLLDPYFSGTKIAWVLREVEAVRHAGKRGTLCVGTIDSYILNRLTGGRSHCTEPSNASRTLLWNLSEGRWDAEMAKMLQIPLGILPEVRDSNALFGRTRGVPGLLDGIPVHGILGDQQSALLGQACLESETAKCTYGTGAFVLMNTGTQIVKSKYRLLSTAAWKFSGLNQVFALEGSAFVAGAAVQWLRDGLGLIRTSEEIESRAREVESTDGVVFVPALTGLGAPYWNPEARGSFSGLTRGTRAGHLARAVLEGIAFQVADLIEAMESDLGKPLRSLNVDGGASANGLLMQFQSDILERRLVRPKNLETTAFGAVFAAGLGAGVWPSVDDVAKAWQKDCEFRPTMSFVLRQEHMVQWRKAIARISLDN